MRSMSFVPDGLAPQIERITIAGVSFRCWRILPSIMESIISKMTRNDLPPISSIGNIKFAISDSICPIAAFVTSSLSLMSSNLIGRQ